MRPAQELPSRQLVRPSPKPLAYRRPPGPVLAARQAAVRPPLVRWRPSGRPVSLRCLPRPTPGTKTTAAPPTAPSSGQPEAQR
eukprot:9320910-Lingulodinium_polyedra.AAC.1